MFDMLKELYANKVRNGSITLEEVPEKFRSDVEELVKSKE